MTIAYKPFFYNVKGGASGPTLAKNYRVGDGQFVLTSIAVLPDPPFRLTVVTLATKDKGLGQIKTTYSAVASNPLLNTLVVDAPIDGSVDRPYSIGDLAEGRIDFGAIADLNAAACGALPSVITGVVAAGSSQSDATPLVGHNSIQEVVSAPSGTGVLAPIPILPSSLIIINVSLNAFFLYPGPGCTINNSGSRITVSPGPPAVRLVASSPTNWYQI